MILFLWPVLTKAVSTGRSLHGELQKLGIIVSETGVGRYLEAFDEIGIRASNG
jgi:hypothetical protein